MINRISGIYLIAVAVAVAVHTVVEPFYHTYNVADMYGAIWGVLDVFMAVALVLGLIFGYVHKSAVDSEGNSGSVSREFFIANTLFYGFLFVSILFFWNWFTHLNPGAPPPPAGKVLIVWLLVDAALPLLAGAMGMHLLRHTIQKS